MNEPSSSDDWLMIARRHAHVAELIAGDKKACGEAVFHAGLAVEAALKARIMRTERFNQWPSRQSRPDLHTHDLGALLKIAGLTITAFDRVGPSWAVIRSWRRAQGYDPKPTPRKVARQFVEAAIGSEGVIPWLNQ